MVRVSGAVVGCLPSRSGCVPHPPEPIFDQYPRRRGQKCVLTVALDNRGVRDATERLASVDADRAADEGVERHAHSSRPPDVVEVLTRILLDDARSHRAAVVECTESARAEHRTRVEPRRARRRHRVEPRAPGDRPSLSVARGEVEPHLPAVEFDERNHRMRYRPWHRRWGRHHDAGLVPRRQKFLSSQLFRVAGSVPRTE